MGLENGKGRFADDLLPAGFLPDDLHLGCGRGDVVELGPGAALGPFERRMDEGQDGAGRRGARRVGRQFGVLGIEAGDAPEAVESVEIDFVVEGLQGTDVLLVEAEPVIRLAQPDFHEEALEIGLLGEGRGLARFRQDVLVEGLEDPLLVEGPGLLQVGFERLVGEDLGAGRETQPARRDPRRPPFGQSREVGDFADPGREGVLEQDAVLVVERRHLVDGIRMVLHLELDAVRRDRQSAGEDLVDRIQLLQPAGGLGLESLETPSGFPLLGEADEEAVDGFAFEGRQDPFREPEESGLVGRENLHFGALDARREEELLDPRSHVLTHGRRFADAEADLEALRLGVPAGQLFGEQGQRVVDLPGEFGFFPEDGFGFAERRRSDFERRAPERGPEGFPEAVLEFRVRAGQGQAHGKLLQLAILELDRRLLELPLKPGLRGAHLPAEETLEVPDDVPERGPARPGVVEGGIGPGHEVEGLLESRRIGRVDDQGGRFAESPGHGFDEPPGVFERRHLEASRPHELPGQGVESHEDGRGQAFRGLDLGVEDEERKRAAGRGQHQLGRERAQVPGGEPRRDDDRGLHGIEHPVLVEVPIEAFGREQPGEVEVPFLGRAPGRFLEGGREKPAARPGPRQNDPGGSFAVSEVEGDPGAGRVGQDLAPQAAPALGAEEVQRPERFFEIIGIGEGNLDSEVDDLAGVESQALQRAPGLPRGRESVSGLADNRPLEIDLLLGQEPGQVVLQRRECRAGFTAPNFPEVGPAQEERAAGPEEGLGRAARADDPPLVPMGEDEDDPLVGPEGLEVDFHLPGRLARPGEIATEENRRRERSPVPGLGGLADEAVVGDQALEIRPGGDVGGQGELGGARVVGDDDREVDALRQAVSVEVLDALARGEDLGQAGDFRRGGRRGGEQAGGDEGAFHGFPSPFPAGPGAAILSRAERGG